LPPNAPKEIVAWYQREFTKAIRSKDYADWREQNVVFYEEAELNPAGLRKHMDELRATFLPVLQKIDLSKE
jgi:tripartite-type tricarboxylate transporter receptor subunit TctC